MDKKEFTEHLRSLGHDAEANEDGVVIHVRELREMKTAVKAFMEEAEKCKYRGSGGGSRRRRENAIS